MTSSRAYRLLAGAGATGIVERLLGRLALGRELVAHLAELAGVEVEHVVDPALVRAHEVMDVRGDPHRMRELTGWEPALPIERTLADSVAWWREQLRTGRAGARLHE